MTNHLDRPVIGITYSARDFDGFELWRHVFHGFVAAGATPLAIDCSLEQPGMAKVVGRLDGLVISGGGDVDPLRYNGDSHDRALRGIDPVRDAGEQSAFEAALDMSLPILAICRGMQLVNVLMGGNLYADLPRDRPSGVTHRTTRESLIGPLHEVEVRPDSLLASWIGKSGVLPVNSEHHQGVRELAPCLSPVAQAPDGLIEAVENAERQLVGVQWHPEIMWPYEASSADLLRGFVSTCDVEAKLRHPEDRLKASDLLDGARQPTDRLLTSEM